MCKFASFVLTDRKAYWLPTSDSHQDIIEHYQLRETGPDDLAVQILRVEIVPPTDGRCPLDLATWQFQIDQDLRPDWAEPVECEARTRAALAERAKTPDWRGQVARCAEGLTADQRYELARESTPEWRGQVARYAEGLTADQRIALARESLTGCKSAKIK